MKVIVMHLFTLDKYLRTFFFVSGTILGTFYMFYRFISPMV